MTSIVYKTCGTRNNSKKSMIVDFISKLDTLLDDDRETILQPTDGLNMVFDPPNDHHLKKSCLNIDCVFIRQLEIFYKTTEFYRLETVSGSPYCIVCENYNNGSFRRSQLDIREDGTITFV